MLIKEVQDVLNKIIVLFESKVYLKYLKKKVFSKKKLEFLLKI